MKDLPKKKKAKHSPKVSNFSKTPGQKTLKEQTRVSSNFLHVITKKKLNGLYLFPLTLLLMVLIVLTIYNTFIKNEIVNLSPNSAPTLNLTSYPYIPENITPQITAESALIFDDSAKVILYEKKPLLRFSMASTTKIMTALVALEYFKKTDILTAQKSYREGAVVGFLPGEQLLFEDMLYALLLPSANDAAFIIAENYPGGLENFVARMNKKAAELKLFYTHYSDPSGLDDDGNYTTIGDLSKLASHALKNEEFTKIMATKKKVIISVNLKNTYTLLNLNRLLGENGVIGMKTGYTQGAGEVLVTTKIEKGHTFIIVVLKSEDRFRDTEILMRYINDNVKFVNPQEYLLQIK